MHNCIFSLEVSCQNDVGYETFFNPFFNGFHSSALVQVIGNKSADLVLSKARISLTKLSRRCKSPKDTPLKPSLGLPCMLQYRGI